MKKIFCVLLFILNVPTVSSQNEIHKKAVENFIIQFNNNDFEGIYQSFSPSMQKSRTKKHFFDFLSRVKRNSGALLKLELLEYIENKVKTARGTYDGNFETAFATVRITVDIRGKITGLYIKRKDLI